MKRLRDFINAKIMPEIKKRRLNSYQVYREFGRALFQKNINSEFFLTNNELDFTNQDHIKFMTLLLKKRSEQRSQLQNSSLLKCFKQMKYFEELQRQTETEAVKFLIKNCRIIRVNKKNLIFEVDEPVENYYILLKGRIGILQNEFYNNPHHYQEKLQQNLLKLLIKTILTTDIKSPRRKRPSTKEQNQRNHEIETPVFHNHNLKNEQLKIMNEIGLGCSFGDDTHNHYTGRKFSAVALEDSYLLEIHMSTFFKAIKYHSDKKMQRQMQLFRKFKCFDMLQDNELKSLIKTTRMEEKPMNEFVFKEGDMAKQFYLLFEGQINLNKVAKLFIQNPNKLYVNRLQMKKEQRYNVKILPFANFENLYNYRPKQSMIQIGIIGGENIFGQQQCFIKQPRQTNAKVISTVAKYYVLDIVQLQMILKQKKCELEDFKDHLFASNTKQKILYRQDKFSEVLSLKNKKNLDYFYMDKGEQIQSPKKFKIQKINNKFNQTENNKKKKIQKDESEKPFYTTFNFNKFLSAKQSIEQKVQTHNPQEKTMFELTHATNYIEKQLNSEKILCGIKNPNRRAINLHSPLFQRNYFISLHKDYMKLEHEQRKKRFSLKPTTSYKKQHRSQKYRYQQV